MNLLDECAAIETRAAKATMVSAISVEKEVLGRFVSAARLLDALYLHMEEAASPCGVSPEESIAIRSVLYGE
jgi:hypothetical protein